MDRVSAWGGASPACSMRGRRHSGCRRGRGGCIVLHMERRTIEVTGLDGFTPEESEAERAVLAEAGLENGWTGEQAGRGAFDDVLDDLHSTYSDASAQAHSAEVDAMNAWEKQFLASAQQELTSRLMASGLWCARAHVDPYRGDGYVFVFRDGTGRTFDVTISVDDALEMRIALGEDWGRRLIDRLTTEAHEARRRYFARMRA
jgi:hypothetical protein